MKVGKTHNFSLAKQGKLERCFLHSCEIIGLHHKSWQEYVQKYSEMLAETRFFTQFVCVTQMKCATSFCIVCKTHKPVVKWKICILLSNLRKKSCYKLNFASLPTMKASNPKHMQKCVTRDKHLQQKWMMSTTLGKLHKWTFFFCYSEFMPEDERSCKNGPSIWTPLQSLLKFHTSSQIQLFLQWVI